MTSAPPIPLSALATQVRRDTVRMITNTGSGHVGGALGAAEIMAALYGAVMNHDLSDPARDRFVLSNGHICAAFYSVLSRVGHLDPAELATFRKLNSRLQGHPARVDLPGLIETSTGPLGQGLSVANGLALASKLDALGNQVFCLLGDGELQEGQVWEALMSANQHRLTNLTIIVSYNGLQIDGNLEDVKSLEPLSDKLVAFGLRVVELDGHDVEALVRALSDSRSSDRPTAIIARTVMGKGVSFMEDLAAWHGKVPSREQGERALEEIGAAAGFADFPIGEPA